MLTKQTFSLGQILSVTTGVLAVRRFDEVKVLLSFMTHTDVDTITSIPAASMSRPHLIKQLPFLTEISADKIVGRECFMKVKALAAKYGEYHELCAIPLEDAKPIDPVQTIRDIKSGKTFR